MKRIVDFAICRLSICLLIGIVLGKYISVANYWLITCCCLLLVVAVIAYRYSFQHFQQKVYYGLLIYSLTICVGWLNYQIHQKANYQNHYIHHIEKDQPNFVSIQVQEVLKPSSYYAKYTAQVNSIDQASSFGKVLIYLPKNLNDTLYPGDAINAYTHIEPLPEPKNPFQFHYGNYLKNEQIYGLLHLQEYNYTKSKNTAFSIIAYTDEIRRFITKQLQSNGLNGEELTIAQALFLGQRQNISHELYNTYVNAGVIHLLAISGLHIGIITTLLMFFCYPLRLLKNGHIYCSILIISLLWGFAFITGFSASVTRSVVMFSLLTISVYLKRPQNTLHNVIASAFILLLWHPNFLFEVGFQLSYCAVIGIVILQPEMQKRIGFRNKIANYFIGIVTTTIAAQIAVLPISLYYFHQFPGLFFIGNLVLIPGLFILLAYGFIVIVLTCLGISNNLLVQPLLCMLKYMNMYIEWIASKKTFVIQHIYFDATLLLLVYLAIFWIAYAFVHRNRKSLQKSLVFALCTQFYCLYVNEQQLQTQQWTLFHQSRQHVVGLQTGKNLRMFAADSTNISYLTEAYKTSTNCSINKLASTNCYRYHSKTILVIDRKNCYQINNIPITHIVLTQSPYINLERVIKLHKPEIIIADGSNYTSSIERWKRTCEKQKIPFHNTYEKGAFILK